MGMVFVVGCLLGLALGRTPSDHLCYLEAERARDLMREIESVRREQMRRASYPLYQVRDPLVLEIGKLPRAMSVDEARDKYGEYYGVTDAIIGKLNQVIEEVNHPTIKKF